VGLQFLRHCDTYLHCHRAPRSYRKLVTALAQIVGILIKSGLVVTFLGHKQHNNVSAIYKVEQQLSRPRLWCSPSSSLLIQGGGPNSQIIQCGKLALPTTTIFTRVDNFGSLGVNGFHHGNGSEPSLCCRLFHPRDAWEDQEASEYEGLSVVRPPLPWISTNMYRWML
jgi:hypothetical protein